MNPWLRIVLLAVVMMIIMTFGWLWQWRRKNAGIVDVLWSTGLGLAALWIALTGHGAAWPRVTLALLGGIWAARLAVHLWHRVRTEAEDGRYRHMRAHWQGSQAKFFMFFQAQALSVLLFALPFIAVADNPSSSPSVWWWLGVSLWCISVIGESTADRQLARFRDDQAHRGKTCRDGLWRYSRHPNYFFEWLHWFTYVALAVGAPDAWLAWCGPVVMLAFLRWISGIPFTEAQALRSRGDDYRDYQQRTSALIPWFPKQSSTRSEP